MTTPPYTLTIERARTALDQTFSEIDGWFGRPEALRAYKPASGGWSIDEANQPGLGGFRPCSP
jgi:hypothetical protein